MVADIFFPSVLPFFSYLHVLAGNLTDLLQPSYL